MTWSEKASSFEDPPVGVYIARCVGIIDLGTQKEEYQGKTKIQRKTVLRWELPTELMTTGDHEGKPFVVNKWYTASLSDKANLRADLVNWRGREFTPDELQGFDEKNLLDKVCMLSLTKNDKGKVRVTGVMSKAKGMVVPDRVNELVYISLEPGKFERPAFEALTDYFKDEIKKSPEWAELNGAAGAVKPSNVDDFDDDIPF
jgi:hypothetical protein